MGGLIKNVLHHTFVTGSLIHIRQTEKIALEITAKVASVNGFMATVLKEFLSDKY
jgi:hypothetical protein